MSASAEIPAESPLLYSQVRDSISDGDIILFQGQRQLSRLIRQVASSAYSHVGLVLTWYGRRILLSAEMPKIQALPLGLAVAGYPGRVDWYRLRPEARSRVDRERLALEALVNLGVEYGVGTLGKLAATYTLGVHGPDSVDSDHDEVAHSLICSQFVSRCFRTAGLDLSPKSDLETDPGEIARSPYLEFVGTLQREVSTAAEARAQRIL